MNSTVKFCENKYEVSSYIYEFFNTISNFIFFLIYYIGYNKHKKNRYSYLCLSGIGTGSCLLHGTGYYVGQLIDEFFMLLFVVLTLNLYKLDTKILFLYNISGLAIYIYFKIYTIFLFLFGSQVGYLCYKSYVSTKKNSKERSLASCGISLFFIGKVLWDLEQNFCHYFPSFKWFHPVWHILSGISGNLILKSNELLFIK